jgi:hypothetical protein
MNLPALTSLGFPTPVADDAPPIAAVPGITAVPTPPPRDTVSISKAAREAAERERPKDEAGDGQDSDEE